MDPKGYGKKTPIITALVLSLFLSGCITSKIIQKVDEVILSKVDADLTATVMLAEKYGEESIAKCAKYLQGALAGKRELLAEETDGLLSTMLKIKLLREFAMADEANFKMECGQFAAGLMLELGNALGDNNLGIPSIR